MIGVGFAPCVDSAKFAPPIGNLNTLKESRKTPRPSGATELQ